jgi:hypothetical protein
MELEDEQQWLNSLTIWSNTLRCAAACLLMVMLDVMHDLML